MAGETLKVGKTNGGMQKMMVFKDTVSLLHSQSLLALLMFTKTGLSYSRVCSHQRKRFFQSILQSQHPVALTTTNV
jgi:hypothetical protein